MSPSDETNDPERPPHDDPDARPGDDAGDQAETGFDLDAYDSDGDGTLDTTVLTTMESVDLDGDGLNDAALMTSKTMTDLDGDGLPDVIETTTTMVSEGPQGELHVAQTTERVFVDHEGDPDHPTRLLEDDDVLPDLPDRMVVVIDDDHPSMASAPSAAAPDETPGVLRGMQHVALCVDDIAAADHFYIDQLGLSRIDRPDLGIAGTWLEAENGLQIHLVELPGSAGPDTNHLAFTVDDVDAAAAALRTRGVDVPEPSDIGAGKQVFLRDPSGNIVELNEPTHLR